MITYYFVLSVYTENSARILTTFSANRQSTLLAYVDFEVDFSHCATVMVSRQYFQDFRKGTICWPMLIMRTFAYFEEFECLLALLSMLKISQFVEILNIEYTLKWFFMRTHDYQLKTVRQFVILLGFAFKYLQAIAWNYFRLPFS